MCYVVLVQSARCQGSTDVKWALPKESIVSPILDFFILKPRISSLFDKQHMIKSPFTGGKFLKEKKNKSTFQISVCEKYSRKLNLLNHYHKSDSKKPFLNNLFISLIHTVFDRSLVVKAS